MEQVQFLTEHSDMLLSEADAHEDAGQYQIAQLDLDQIRAVYHHIEPLLETVYERSNGELDGHALAQELNNRRMQMWIVTDGERVAAVIGTSIDIVATGKKKATIRFCAGHHSEKWLHLLDEIEAWAAFEGCSSMTMIARKGWAKKLQDYKLTHVVLEKAI